MPIETHAQEVDAMLFAVRSLMLSAFAYELSEYQRLDAKRQANAASKPELRRLAKLDKLANWIYSEPPKVD